MFDKDDLKLVGKIIAALIITFVFIIGCLTIHEEFIGRLEKAEAAVRVINIPDSNKTIRVEQNYWAGGIYKYRIVIPKGYFKTGIQTVSQDNKLYCFLEVMETREPFEPRQPLKTHLIKLTEQYPLTSRTRSVTFNVEQEH